MAGQEASSPSQLNANCFFTNRGIQNAYVKRYGVGQITMAANGFDRLSIPGLSQIFNRTHGSPGDRTLFTCWISSQYHGGLHKLMEVVYFALDRILGLGVNFFDILVSQKIESK